MKNIAVLFIVIFCAANAVAQQNTFTSVINDISRPAITPAFDNGYMITGNDYYSSYLLKTDEEGTILWSKEYENVNTNTTPALFFNAIIPTFDSCFAIAGHVYNNATTYEDALVMKVTASGDTLWSKVLSHSTHYLEALSIKQTYDSGYVISGHSPWGEGEFNGILIGKLDADGNLQWSTILNNGNNSHYGYRVKQTSDSGYVVIGFFTSVSPYEEYAFLTKLNQAGIVQWAKKYNYSTPLFCFGNDVIQLNDGYLCYLNTGEHTSLMKTDLQGNEVWTKQYIFMGTNNTIPPRSRGLYKTSDTTYVMVSGSDYSGSLTTVDTSGNVVWSKGLMLSAVDALHTADNGYLVVGYGPWVGVMQTPNGANPRSSVAGTGSQIGLIKTDSIGNSISCVQDQFLNVNDEHILSSDVLFTTESGVVINPFYPVVSLVNIDQRNGCIDFHGGLGEAEQDLFTLYPNPASSTISILPIAIGTMVNSSWSVVNIYNAQGQLVSHPLSRGECASLSAGKGCVLDISQLPPGLYYLHLQSAEGVGVKKFEVIR